LAEAPGLRSHPGSPELPGGVVRAISRTCSAAVFAGLPRLECQAEKKDWSGFCWADVLTESFGKSVKPAEPGWTLPYCCNCCCFQTSAGACSA